jgi:transposase
MGKPYSDDLRERVVAAIEAGHTREEVAKRYNMALSTFGGFIKRKREGRCQSRQVRRVQDFHA